MPEMNYADSLNYWLGEKGTILYTVLLSSDTIKVMNSNEDTFLSSHWKVYSKSIKKGEIKSILLTYSHLKWDVSEVFGLI